METKKLISWSVNGNTVTALFGDGSVKTVTRDHKWGNTIISLLLRNADAQEIWDAFDRAATLNRTIKSVEVELGGNRLTCKLEDGKIAVRYNDEVIGGPVVDKIIQFMDEGLPVAPLAKFLMRLMKNPSYNSRQQLYAFLAALNMPITCEGTFLACKGVREDYKDCHTGTFDNSPGVTNEMKRRDVDENPNNHCSSGFHVGAWEYASSFGKRVVLVEVDPADVVSVPNDHNAQKCRVTRYKVLSDMLEPVNGPLKDVNPPTDEDDADDDCDCDCDDCNACDDVSCPRCGGDAEMSNDGSVVCSECDCNACDRIFTCAKCGAVLKTTHDKTDYRPCFCSGCGAKLNYDRSCRS